MITKLNTTIRAFDTITLDEAARELWHLTDRVGLVPTHTLESVQDTVADLQRSAAALNITTLGGLCNDVVDVLQHVASIDSVTGFHNTDNADRLHTYRNTALALALACALHLDIAAPPVIGHFPTLRARTPGRATRPHTNDEILLMRVHAIGQLRHVRNHTSAHVYAMVEAGATPVETTAITQSDFDLDQTEPTFMLVPHVNQYIRERTIDHLDTFSRHVLRHLRRDAQQRRALPDDTPLTYQPTTSNPTKGSAAASASGILDRIHKALGLYHPDTAADSVRRWRIQTTYQTRGTEAATQVAGVPTDRMRTLIGIASITAPQTSQAHLGGFLTKAADAA